MKEKTCCFIGHRKIQNEEKLKAFLRTFIRSLVENGFTRFIFGSKSDFDNICLEIATELKEEYPEIYRIGYLTKAYSGSKRLYEEVCKPDFIYTSGKAVYVERNQYIIDQSDYCIFYYDKNYIPPIKIISKKRYVIPITTSGKSGTEIAYKYALKKKKQTLNIFYLI